MSTARMRAPTPLRALAGLLAVIGAGVVWLNLDAPDESRTLGVIVLCVGVAGLALRETRGLFHVVEAVSVIALILAGGERLVRRENSIAARAYAEKTMHFVDDPWLRYEMKADVSCGTSITNSFGMLDRARTLEKPAGTLRVACLGDSVGGDCSLPDDNACAALESVLRDERAGKPVEVLNFSVPGYNTMQEARALEVKALRFDPDVAVVLYVINDPGPDLAISHYLPGHLKFEHLLARAARMATAKLVGSRVDPFGGMFQQLHESPRSWDAVVVAGFDRIRAAADARHMPVVVAIFPLFLDGWSTEYAPIYAKVAREARAHGFLAVNLAEAAFATEAVSALLKPSHDMVHPNAHAHHLAAEAIAHALVEQHPDLLR